MDILPLLSAAEVKNAITHVTEALIKFQDVYCFRGNGTTSEETLEFMRRRHCGVSDFPMPFSLKKTKMKQSQLG